MADRDIIYEKDGARWFRTTDYGDEKDRVVVKEDGQWKIKAVHAGANFMDNPVLDGMKALMWRNQLLAAAIGALLGLGGGVLLAKKFGKR